MSSNHYFFAAACSNVGHAKYFLNAKGSATSHKSYQKLVTTTSLGEERTLQTAESDVSVDIPEKSPGIYTVYICTRIDKSELKIPEDECLISPIVRIEFQELQSVELNLMLNMPLGVCRVNIPHCIQETSEQKEVKVYHFSSSIQPNGVEE